MSTSRPLFWLCFLLAGLFWSIVGGFPATTSVSMPGGCVKLSRPPYFYCLLDDDSRERTEAQIKPEDKSTTSTPIEKTILISEESITFEVSETTEAVLSHNLSTPAPEPSEFETLTNEAFFTSKSAKTLDLIEEETMIITTVKPTTLSVEAEIMQGGFSRMFRASCELRQPPPKRLNGPTIMEEYFIDTLTGGAQNIIPAQLAKALELKSAKRLIRLCRRFLLIARFRCRGEYTHPSYVSQCQGFFDDCGRFVPLVDSVYELSRSFQQNIFYGSNYPFVVKIH